jgi:hypothetical protein
MAVVTPFLLSAQTTPYLESHSSHQSAKVTTNHSFGWKVVTDFFQAEQYTTNGSTKCNCYTSCRRRRQYLSSLSFIFVELVE